MVSIYGANVLGVCFTTVAYLERLHLKEPRLECLPDKPITARSISGF